MIGIGIVSLISYLLCYFGVTETVTHKIDESAESVSYVEGLKGLLKNKPFMAVCIASLGILFGLGINGTMTYYYFSVNLQDIGKMDLMGLVMAVP